MKRNIREARERCTRSILNYIYSILNNFEIKSCTITSAYICITNSVAFKFDLLSVDGGMGAGVRESELRVCLVYTVYHFTRLLSFILSYLKL